MSLRLVTRNGPTSATGVRTVQDLEGARLTIGRDPASDWTLPSHVVSRHHCTIEQVDGRYMLTDTSTNGVYVDDAVTPVGNGNSIELTDGVRLHIGDYEIEVLIDEPAQARPAPASDLTELEDESMEGANLPPVYDEEERVPGFAPLPHFADWEERGQSRPLPPEIDRDHPIGDVFEPPRPVPPRGGAEPPPQGPSAEPAAMPPRPTTPTPGPSEELPLPEDWLEAAEEAETGTPPPEVPAQRPPLPEPPPEPPATGPEPPAAPEQPWPPQPSAAPAPPPPEQAQQPPQQPPLGEIAAPSPGAPPFPEPPSPEPPPSPAAAPYPAKPTKGPAAGPTGGAEHAVTESRALEAFFSGAGIRGEAAAADPEQTMRMAGEILRSVTEGAIQLLDARSRIKGEMGVEQTVLAAHGNNPLKFSSDAGQALELLFDRGQQGYLPPRQAFAEAFEDIVEHELSLLTGVQDAWNELLARLDPEALERRLGKEKGLSALLQSAKGRCWDVYRERYKETVDDADRIFRLRVASAYERQRGTRRRRSR